MHKCSAFYRYCIYNMCSTIAIEDTSIIRFITNLIYDLMFITMSVLVLNN